MSSLYLFWDSVRIETCQRQEIQTSQSLRPSGPRSFECSRVLCLWPADRLGLPRASAGAQAEGPREETDLRRSIGISVVEGTGSPVWLGEVGKWVICKGQLGGQAPPSPSCCIPARAAGTFTCPGDIVTRLVRALFRTDGATVCTDGPLRGLWLPSCSLPA